MKTPGDGGLTWQRQQLPARSREGKGERRYDFLVHHDCFFIAGTILRSINPASPILESISDESLGRICIWITFWLRAFWHYSLEIQLVARLIFFAIGENRLKCVLKHSNRREGYVFCWFGLLKNTLALPYPWPVGISSMTKTLSISARWRRTLKRHFN